MKNNYSLTTKKKIANKATLVVAAYLKSIGWNAVVMQFWGIEQDIPKHNYRLIIKFTGDNEEKKHGTKKRIQ